MSAETVEARAAIVTATVEIMGNFIIENMEWTWEFADEEE